MDTALIIMDMDGVITSEKRYWEAAAFAVYEILFSEEYLGLRRPFPPASFQAMSPHVITMEFVSLVKESGINNNWDLAFLSLSLFLAHIAGGSEGFASVCRNADSESFAMLRNNAQNALPDSVDAISDSFFSGMRKGRVDLVSELNGLVFKGDEVLTRESALWKLVKSLFQNWYLGTEKDYQEGLLKTEETVIPLESVRKTLQKLKQSGFTLAVATGRPSQELIPLLEGWKLLHFFDEERICTFDTVAQGEASMSEFAEKKINLSKPSPYVFQKAVFPHLSPIDAHNSRAPYPVSIIIVGDAAGDLMAAETMKVPSILVSTGVEGKNTDKLKVYNPVAILDSIADIPQFLSMKSSRGLFANFS